ncbi:NYN domain-containing protein [Micromonospora lupini]|uniref:NYN domain-containing protein n=1 Tax=Micromonospora lupini TaxID=285679 RepID=UPI00225539CD|nr:NYN domain-containing protein [Micromonospora lupini]MCX5065007.1 NYN domain-containing protein [Micromonospora lupini]
MSTLRRWWGHWPTWTGYAAAGLALIYGGLGVYWTAGGDGFPFAPVDPARASGSILEGSRAEVVAPIIAVLGLLGAVVAWVMTRRTRPGRLSTALVVVGGAVAVGLTLIIPDYTLIMLVAFAPLLLVFAVTGVPGDQGGVGDILYWHRTNLIILFLVGLLWAAATVAYRRRVRGACAYCGRRHGADPGPARQTLLRRGRWAVAIACLAPLPYEVTRIAWYLGWPLGISRDFLRMMQDTPGMLEVGLGCAIASTLGGVLTHGLVARWGEVYPRWIWFSAGKRVPPALAVVPASIVAVTIIPAGLMFLWTSEARGTWALYVPSLFWPVWGVALGAATIAYHLRRRGACRHCGLGHRPGPEPHPPVDEQRVRDELGSASASRA